MPVVGDEVARLLQTVPSAQPEKCLGIRQRYLIFVLITHQPLGIGGRLQREEALIATATHAHRGACRVEVTLINMQSIGSLSEESQRGHEELTFDLFHSRRLADSHLRSAVAVLLEGRILEAARGVLAS